ncbi:AIR carboxylase family protein [Candidatus Peregrinibacteria bacterium]|nr:AIR carboxylase family protein [Candidatus Peregrinibacteria bacterium]
MSWFVGLTMTCPYTVFVQVTILLGSENDKPHAEKISAVLTGFDIPSNIIIASAHKVPEKVVSIIEKLNKDLQPQVVITVVGLSNGLAGVVAGSSLHPVINCPPHKNEQEYLADIHSSLRMPSYVPVMTILNPKNAALAAVKILAESNKELREQVKKNIADTKNRYS